MRCWIIFFEDELADHFFAMYFHVTLGCWIILSKDELVHRHIVGSIVSQMVQE